MSKKSVKQSIEEVLSQVLEEMGKLKVEVELERPGDGGHGDWSSSVALKLKNHHSQTVTSEGGMETEKSANPREFGEQIREAVSNRIGQDEYLSQVVAGVEVAGPGFVNFYLKDGYYLEGLERILKKEAQGGLSSEGRQAGDRKKIIVEYSSPNIAKPFTVGHLRSTIIGEAIANLLETQGHEVLRDNHLGDWGTQFGKQIYAILHLGRENEVEELERMERPVERLVELYVRFHEEAEQNLELEEKAREWFKRLEDGNQQARELWQKCVDWSWKEFEAIYERLGVTFSDEFDGGRGWGESFFEDKMEAVIEELEAKGLLTEGEGGAKIVEFGPEEKLPPAMIVKSDGATLYHTRDLAADKYRLEKLQPDMIINEVGGEQELYFRQLIKMEEMLGWFKAGQRVHVKHGLYRFAEGKMSTRKGNVIWLEEVLAEAVDRAGQVMDKAKKGSDLSPEERAELVEMVGIGALKWNDLKSAPERAVVFDWDEILNMQGNSGPYVQYTHARARSVLRKSQFSSLTFQCTSLGEVELNHEEREVLRQLARYDETVERAAEELTPHLVAGYVYELAQRFNSFYNKHSILGEGKSPRLRPISEGENFMAEERGEEMSRQQRELRLALTAGVGERIKAGLGLLGIGAPEKM